MKKNIAIWILAGLVGFIVGLMIFFFYLWRDAEINLSLHKEKVAQIAETFADQMERRQENFEWSEFIRRAGVDKLLTKSLEGVGGQKEEDVKTEIEKRLLGYPREINVAESRRELVQILLQSPTGKVYLASFMAEAKETIRIYEEERKKRGK